MDALKCESVFSVRVIPADGESPELVSVVIAGPMIDGDGLVWPAVDAEGTELGFYRWEADYICRYGERRSDGVRWCWAETREAAVAAVREYLGLVHTLELIKLEG